MQCIAFPPAYHKAWIASMEDLQQEELPTEPSLDSFRDLLAQTFYDLPDAVKQEAFTDSPHSKEAAAAHSGRSDVEQRRDAVPGLTTAGTSGQQASHPSSGAGSEQGTSSSQHQHDHGPGRGRGRGRRSKRVAGQQETAQQRAHRRFYERKKQKMAALEQEFAERQTEYQRLMRENVELKRKHDALEWAIAGRDEQMSLMQALSNLSLNPQVAPQQPQSVPGMAPGPGQQTHVPQPPHLANIPGSHSAPAVATPAATAAAAMDHTALHRRSGSAPQPSPHQQQQQQSAALAQQYAAAGPFGAVQLLTQDELPAMPAPAPAAAAAASFQQQQQYHSMQQQQQPRWPDSPPYLQQQQQQQQQGLHLQRSISMPVRTSNPAVSPELAAAAAAGRGLPVLQGHPVAAAAADMHRSYSTQARVGGPGPAYSHQQQQQQQRQLGSSSTGYPPISTGWTAGPSRLQQVSTQQQQQQPLLGEVLRGQSWSGPNSPMSDVTAAAAVQRSAQSYPSDPTAPYVQQQFLEQQQQQFLEQQQQQQRRPMQYFRSISMPSRPTAVGSYDDSRSAVSAPAAAAAGAPAGPESSQSGGGWPQGAAAAAAGRRGLFHTITTAGPVPMQQQQQMQRTGSDPTAYGSRLLLPQAEQQQQQQQPNWQQQQQLLAQAGPFSGQGAMPPPQQQTYMPQQQQQQSLLPQQQLQQQLEQQYVNIQPPAPTENDLMLIDDDLMLLLEQSLTQQQQEGLTIQTSSGMLLSPLPSIPDAAATAAAAADCPHQQQQQQQGLDPAISPDLGAGQSPAAAAAAAAGSSGVGSPVLNLLHASQQLQARHEAAGFYPPAAGPAEFFYMHHLVDWYRSKIHQMSGLLPRVDCPVPDVSAGVALVQVVEETLMGIRKFSTRNRVGIWELKLINLETGDMAEAPISHWRSVLAQLAMSPSQREQPLACYSLFQEYMDKCKQERLAILKDLNELDSQLTGFSGVGAASGFSGFGVQQGEGLGPQGLAQSPTALRDQYLQPKTLQFRHDGLDEYQTLLERLQVSMTREHMVANMLMYSMVQVVSHAQMAKGMVAAYPFWPNGSAIMLLMQEEESAAAAAAARQDRVPRGWMEGGPVRLGSI